MSPIMLVCAGILILGFGLGCGYWFAQRQRQRETTRADRTQKELDEYRRHVTEHFGKTAQHFQALGMQYQSLYKHMAQGADALCDPAQSGALLEFPAGDTAEINASSESSENSPESVMDHADEEEIEAEKVIRDYAVLEEDIESPQMEAEDNPATGSEPGENLTAPDVGADEMSVDEAIVEQVATPPDVEKERTVH